MDYSWTWGGKTYSGFVEFYFNGVSDITQDLQLTAGDTVPWGGSGTEFGWFPIPGTGYISSPPVMLSPG
jgi:hypothetical protein